ncbi:hypothetical protein IFU40_05570 [Microbacterium sp. CFBP 13617]|uniref:hypothetical protein n=1 Tax=Microbacterium sp. CFBP 13617 TaxID=2774035 RepID=UPI001784B343|nr:hypothetical protein [Microbacterium sp. CFBP 13617]MBD8218105.1 hypothetical protein [Microbacterium sp. CFBP 13617]
MATYGYRVHYLEPHIRRTQNFLTVEDVSQASDDTDAIEDVHRRLLALQDETHVGRPTYFVSDEHEALRQADMDEANDLPYLTILKVDREDRVIEILVETGREQDHDGIRTRDGQEEPIRRKAAVRRSWVVLAFPRKGDRALMVSEVRGRTFAGVELFELLTRTAQREKVRQDEKGNKTEDPWLNWKLTPCVDGDRLDGILNGSSDHAIKLRRNTVNAQGNRGSYDIELVQFGLKSTPIERLTQVILDMAHRKGSDTEEARRRAAAADVVTLVEPNVGGVEFTDAEISFKENGKTQTVTSETVDKLFVYPIGSQRMKTAMDLRSKAAPVVQRIAPTLGIQADLSVADSSG